MRINVNSLANFLSGLLFKFLPAYAVEFNNNEPLLAEEIFWIKIYDGSFKKVAFESQNQSETQLWRSYDKFKNSNSL